MNFIIEKDMRADEKINVIVIIIFNGANIWRIIHFGINPIKGGIPEVDKIVDPIKNFSLIDLVHIWFMDLRLIFSIKFIKFKFKYE